MASTLTLIREVQTALDAGDYVLRATQQISAGSETETWTTTQRFRVAGPRFVLGADTIAAAFPPPHSEGDYNHLLPYLVLRRATLPWERQPGPGDDRPFLALLILAEREMEEAARIATLTIDAFCQARGLALESGDDAGAEIPVVDADSRLLSGLLPTLDELQLLTHVRQREGEPSEAVILGNRRPLPDTSYTVHLVSLEGLDPGKLPAGRVMLPSLYRWRFTCGSDRVGLVERLNDLSMDGLKLPVRPKASWVSQDLRRAGYAVMPYQLAWGDRSYALYRGPLLPGSVNERLEWVRPRAAGRQSSQGLAIYLAVHGLLDISLAAAWELGRMLLLRRHDIAMHYHRFRRRQAGQAHRARGADGELHLLLDDATPSLDAMPPDEVVQFCRELMDLHHIPFSYLIPDPRMLPERSLRAFRVDYRWLCCLLGGVLSLGRARAVDREREAVYLESLLPDAVERSGIWIRSPVVAERPHQTYVLKDAAGKTLPIVLREHMGDDVLLMVVDGIVHTVEAREEPGAAHFGFKEDSEPGASGAYVEYFEKDLRDPGTFLEMPGKTIRLTKEHLRGPDMDVLNIQALAKAFAAKDSRIQVQSHHLALQLIECGARGIRIPLGEVKQ